MWLRFYDRDMTSLDANLFTFDLDRGIRDQLIEKFGEVQPVPLVKGVGPTESGVYQLLFKGELVYIGKATKTFTKSKRTLRGRLGEHIQKISKSELLELNDFTVKFVTFDSDWWVIAGEVALIRHVAPLWNSSGFGSKTPGSGRPGTERVSKFESILKDVVD